MEELPGIISDLSLILIVAGVVTIIFKRLKQPLVLGYIVAGFLAGPHMPYMPTADDPSVGVWSQIGVVFMMFALGLEFSFKKIVKMGMSPIIAALCIMVSMIFVGNAVGALFDWSGMDRLFLGGMLAMSSTTIIYKAFDDLGLRTKKFASGVMSVLILEDILGILLMVILSALAVSQKFEGGELALSLFKLGFFLLLWFVVGIYIIPLFLKKNSRFINSETLLIVSVGLCFALVVVASKAGYSPAFGAFMMGSILAETVEAERIEHAIGSVKDLFGAIFFVSVGMLVDPAILALYWLPILAITIAIILGQTIFGTMSFVLSGQTLRGGMQSGFSMAQIGEFAFIIAALGESKGVTSNFLYPVVVAVSIVTTFLTPYMIKAAVPVHEFIEKLMPEKLVSAINERNTHTRNTDVRIGLMEGKFSVKSVWQRLLGVLVRQFVVYMVVTVATIAIILPTVLLPCRSLFGNWAGNAVCGVLTLTLISPFLRAIVMRKNHSREFKFLSKQGTHHMLMLAMTILLRFAFAVLAVYYVLNNLSPFWWPWHVLVSVVIVLLMCWSRVVKYTSIRIERTFKHNLSRRDILSAMNDNTPTYARKLQSRDLHITRLTLPDNSSWGGKKLMQLRFGRDNNVLIAAIIRGKIRINIPDGNVMLFPRDVLEVVGDDVSIGQLADRMNAEVDNTQGENSEQLRLERILIDAGSPYLNISLQQSDIRKRLHCMVIGFEEEDGSLSIAQADHVFRQGDKMWIAVYNS